MKRLCLLFMLFGMGYTYAQQLGGGSTPSYNPPTVVPPTPEVASLQKFTETPVSYQTGVPNISIPIASLSGTDLSTAVSISYHAGGHRVGEESTWVGLGWSLAAGGQISRTVRGLADDKPTYGYINTQYTVENTLQECTPVGGVITQQCKSLSYANGSISQFNDYEPDEFSFSGSGVSGRFMFDQNRNVGNNNKGNIIQFEGRGVKIEPVFGALDGTINGPSKIREWNITDTNGTVYHYVVGNKFVRSQYFPIVNGAVELCENCGNGESYVETWDLQSIVSMTGDSIAFEYERPVVNSWANRNEVNYSLGEEKILLQSSTGGFINPPPNGIMPRTSSLVETERSFTQITKIISSQGSIEFVKHTANRQDTQSPKKALKSIIVKDIHGNKVEEVELVQGYFQSSASTRNNLMAALTPAFSPDPNSFLKRLYLQEVRVKEATISFPESYSYKFTYNTSEMLPDKHSWAQDHWGYYNGAIGNQSLIPGSIGNLNLPHSSSRAVNPNYTQACMLTQIEFPEGGKTVFTYENNVEGITPPGNGIATDIVTMDAVPSTSHTISHNGNQTTYVFYKSFTIGTDAVSAPGNSSKTEVDYDGFTSRCGDVDMIYGPGDEICNRMFLRIYPQGSNTAIVSEPIWRAGTVQLNKGGTYKVEIEMTTESTVTGLGQTVTDYDFNTHTTNIDIRWQKNIITNPVVHYLGGLRVKEIENYDGANLESHKKYTYEEGYALSKPSYVRITKLLNQDQLSNTILDQDHISVEMVSQSWIPLISTQAKYQGYKRVIETFQEVDKPDKNGLISIGGNANLKSYDIVRTYVAPQGYAPIFPGAPFEPLVDRNNLESEEITGRQLTTNLYDNISFRTQEFLWGYKPSTTTAFDNFDSSFLSSGMAINPGGFDNSIQCGIYSNCSLPGSVYQIAPKVNLLKKVTLEKTEQSGSLTQVTDNYYESVPIHYNPTKKITTGSDGKVTEQRMTYSGDTNNANFAADNRINILLEATTIKDNVVLQRIKNDYALDQGNYLPKKVKAQKYNEVITGGLVASVEPEERLVYHSYYANGKVREVSKKDGTHIVYIWGYNGIFPVAKIENATYSEVSGYVAGIENASNLDNDRTIGTAGNEGALRTALNNLRNVSSLSDAMITTFTYDPLIGVTSITDSRGSTYYYNYDGFKRLISVKDQDGNIVSENAYHYKN